MRSPTATSPNFMAIIHWLLRAVFWALMSCGALAFLAIGYVFLEVIKAPPPVKSAKAIRADKIQ